MILLAVKSAQLGLEKNDTHVIFAGVLQLANVVPYAKFIYIFFSIKQHLSIVAGILQLTNLVPFAMFIYFLILD